MIDLIRVSSEVEEAQILNALKLRFPATKFIVSEQDHVVGSSLTIGWSDGPTKRRVHDVVQHSNRIQLERELSHGFVKRIEAQLNAFHGPEPWRGNRWSLISQAAEDATIFSTMR